MIEQLRAEIKKLQNEREKVVFEKGLSAQFNNDLRENSEYDSWEQMETNLTAKIILLLKEIDRLTKKKKIVKPKTKKKQEDEIELPTFPKHKWL